jgi:CHASE2 domain-containing sensor protein
VFRDKIVFVGTSGGGLSDILATPFKAAACRLPAARGGG